MKKVRVSLLILALLPFCVTARSAVQSGVSDSTGFAPQVYMVGYAHFDTQWRWTVQQSIGEFLPNLMYQNFKLFEEFPDYIFNFEGAVKYAWMKEYYPEAFEKVKLYVEKGNWHLSGCTWDANDPNIPSVESSFRNILLGQEFFKKEFGKKSYDILLPDCFGFGLTMPTVASHCGILGFSTQKLTWRNKPFYDGGKKIPFEFGLWQGVDGSRIFAALNGGGYGWNPNEDLTDHNDLKKMISSSAVNAAYRYFGTRSSQLMGDRGGSPLPRTVRNIDRAIRKASAYEISFATSDQIYKDFGYLKDSDVLPVFEDELLMDVHATGCYTSQALMKTLNRRNEQLAAAAEGTGVMADYLGLQSYPKEALNDAWKRFIWHQFHDDLTGTSIPDAYRFSWNDEIVAQNQFAGVSESSVAAVVSVMDTRVAGMPVVVYNPVSRRNRELVEVTLPLSYDYADVAVYDAKGRKLKSQMLSHDGKNATVIFASDIPSLGVAVYDIRPLASRRKTGSGRLSVSGNTIENSVYKISLDANGDISSLIDKRNSRQMVEKGKSFGLTVFEENRSDKWPAWEILKEVVDREPVAVADDVKITVAENGPLRVSLRVEKKFGESSFVQYIRLTDGSSDDRIDVETFADWQSERSLLKARFPVSFNSEKAVYDLGLGCITRGNNTVTAYEVYAQQWADMTSEDGKYGLTVLNDCKYGWDKPADNEIRLTLLHTPTADGNFWHEKTQDLGKHRFTYSLCAHQGVLRPEEAAFRADALNQKKLAYLASPHAGVLGKEFSFASTTEEALRIRCLKKAEDGDGIIVRTYEHSGADVLGAIEFCADIESAEEVNGIEEYIGPAEFSGRKLKVASGHFAPKTFRVRLKKTSLSTPEMKSEFVKLPYNVTAITSDAFPSIGQMDSEWNSIPAELLPDTLYYKGIPFRFGAADYANAVRSQGQTLTVPEDSDGVYLLVASSDRDRTATFGCGPDKYSFNIPSWSGFFGQCAWKGHSESFLKDADIAFVGTHKHNPKLRNVPYEFAYMYMIYVPVNGKGTITLPQDRQIVVFGATAVRNAVPEIEAASETVTPVN